MSVGEYRKYDKKRSQDRILKETHYLWTKYERKPHKEDWDGVVREVREKHRN